MYFLTVLTVHTVLCVTLIGLVLLQQGKGADAGATFGGGSSNSVFGAAGATDFITKLTTSLAVGFMITSILLIRAYNSDGGVLLSTEPREITEGSIMEQVLEPEAVTVETVTGELEGGEASKKDDGAAATEEAATTGTVEGAVVGEETESADENAEAPVAEDPKEEAKTEKDS